MTLPVTIGAPLFGRSVWLQLGAAGQPIIELRVAFKIVRDVGSKPNTAEITVYNLGEASRTLVQLRNLPILLQAGYGLALETLFLGQLRYASSVLAGPDWVTTIHGGDGEAAYRSSRVNATFGQGTPIAAIGQAMAAATGLNPGNVVQKLQQGDASGALTQAVNGLTAVGNAYDKLKGMVKSLGSDLSIQDGQLQALGKLETTLEPIVLLSPTTGLIGSPEVGDKGIVKAKALLLPGARPGRRIQLQSRAFPEGGMFRVEKVTHTGDTRAQPWYSDLDLLPVI